MDREPGGIRTPNLRIRSAVLYPVKLQVQLTRGRQTYAINLHSSTMIRLAKLSIEKPVLACAVASQKSTDGTAFMHTCMKDLLA
jgi:hypothetical protein